MLHLHSLVTLDIFPPMNVEVDKARMKNKVGLHFRNQPFFFSPDHELFLEK